MEKENNFLDSVLKNRALSHILFWLFVLLIAPFTSTEGIDKIGEALMYRAVALPVKIIATYILAYYQIPKLLQKKKYIQFIISFIVGSFVFTVMARFVNVYIAETIANWDAPKESLLQMIMEIEYTYFDYFFRVYFFGIIFIFIKMIKERSKEKHEMAVLQKEKATAELNFLKAQIHPHFLFNTLNNLYALTIDKSDKAPDVVAKLSEMLDYMLYQCREDKVLVNKEIELLNHYIDLEKLRYGERLQLNFHSATDQPNALIAPLILISIVENAFKHGVSNTIDESIINISLEIKNERLNFKVYNTKTITSKNDEKGYREGIGIKNIKRQLELLYPDQYEWKVEENKESYQVYLKLAI